MLTRKNKIEKIEEFKSYSDGLFDGLFIGLVFFAFAQSLLYMFLKISTFSSTL